MKIDNENLYEILPMQYTRISSTIHIYMVRRRLQLLQYCVILTYPRDSIDKKLISRCINSILERLQIIVTKLQIIEFVG